MTDYQSAVNAIDSKIAHFMVDKKINQEQMAQLCGLKNDTLRNRRNGKTKWTWEEAIILSDLLGVSLDELAGK